MLGQRLEGGIENGVVDGRAGEKRLGREGRLRKGRRRGHDGAIGSVGEGSCELRQVGVLGGLRLGVLGGGDGNILIDALGNDGLLELAGRVELEEVTGGEGVDHAIVVGLQVVIDLGQDEGSQLALGERVVFVQGLTAERGSALPCLEALEAEALGLTAKTCGRGLWQNAHLAQSSGHLGPNGVDIIVERLQGKDFELGLFVGQKGQDAGRRDEARHRDGGLL